MNAMQKIKLSKERVNLIADLKSGNLKGMAKIKASKRVVDIVVLLGGAVTPSSDKLNISETPPATNPLYQSVLDGAAITVELIEKVIEEAKKDVSHPQLRPVVIRIRDHEQELIAA